jgi:hypothetical protein
MNISYVAIGIGVLGIIIALIALYNTKKKTII